MIRPLLVLALALAAPALSASAQSRIFPPPPPPASTNVVLSVAYAEAMAAVQTLQSAAAIEGPDAANARADLQQIAAAASR